jgi:hypothetical protein
LRERDVTVSSSELAVGKCYITGASQVRRIVEVSEFEVKYQALDGELDFRSSEEWVAVSREKFAAEVDREVACPA